MIKRSVYGFAIDLKSTLISLNLWGSIVAVTLFAFTLPSRGCMLDRLFELLKGPIYQFMNDGGLPKFMAWMMPHTLVSVIIGRETEVLLNCIQFRLPRYRYRSSFWLSHSLKTIFITIVYYLLCSSVVGVAVLTGNVMPGVSLQMGRLIHTDNDNTVLLMSLLFFRACLPMCIILHVQSFCQVAFRSAFAGGVAFVLFVAVSAFIPESVFSKYMIGNWLILSRSIHMHANTGINDTMILIGVFVSFILIQAVGLRLFKNRSWY